MIDPASRAEKARKLWMEVIQVEESRNKNSNLSESEEGRPAYQYWGAEERQKKKLSKEKAGEGDEGKEE